MISMLLNYLLLVVKFVIGGNWLNQHLNMRSETQGAKFSEH